MQARRFETGVILATAGALRAMEFNEVTPQRLVGRHVSGDWGHLPAGARQDNEQEILVQAGTITSRYRLDDGEIVLVTTEFPAGRTLISQPGDDEEIERCAAGWRRTLQDASSEAVPSEIARFLVLIRAEEPAG